MSLEALRREVLKANRSLPELGLVRLHSGNVSGYDPESGVVVIKPSGMDYQAIVEDSLVDVDFESGRPSTTRFSPSVDLPHHLHLYRHLPGIRGIVHTHSNYATAFAACGMPIPMALTSVADQFGDEIPCAPYADNEGLHIAESILKHRNSAPAILLANHGVFAWGDSPSSALKSAAMVEDAAKTIWLAMQIGRPLPLPAEEAEKWHDRYRNRYGQR